MGPSSTSAMDIETSVQLSANALSTDIDPQDVSEASDKVVNHSNLGQNSRRAYLKELKKVVETADVILHVLDARDPAGDESHLGHRSCTVIPIET